MRLGRVGLGSVRAALCVTLAGLLALALAAGCGVKNAPIPPSKARPERIPDLEAESVTNGIKLTWGRPEHYAGGGKLRDLAGFVLMRATGDGPYRMLTELPVLDQERFQVAHRFSYLDKATVLGRRYRYELISVTGDGYKSEPSNEIVVERTKPPPPPTPESFVLPTPKAEPSPPP